LSVYIKIIDFATFNDSFKEEVSAMPSRREAVKALVAVPGVIFAQSQAPQKKTLVITVNGQKTLDEILARGGEVTSVTIHYDLPCEPGRSHRGAAFFSPKRKEFTIK